MRTTVEITDEQHRRLGALATRRRMRGFSTLVQEAIDLYLAEQDSQQVEAALGLEGSVREEEALEMERRIAEAWTTWPAGS